MPVRSTYWRPPGGIIRVRRVVHPFEHRYLPPWSGPFEKVEYSGPTAGTTETFSPVNTIPVGTLAILAIALTTQFAVTASDNSTQPGGANAWQQGAGPSGSGIACRLFFCVISRPILSTDVITATHGSTTRRHGWLFTFTGNEPLVSALGNRSVSTSNIVASPGLLNNNVLNRTRCLSICVSGWSGLGVLSGFTDTTGAGWIASPTAAGSGGGSPQIEANASWNLDVPVQAFNHSHSWTSITGACMVFCNFFGPGILGPVISPKVIRMVRSGA